MPAKTHPVLTAAALYINCPVCGEGIEAPNGSFVWMTDEYRAVAGTKQECGNCGAFVKIPDQKRVEIV